MRPILISSLPAAQALRSTESTLAAAAPTAATDPVRRKSRRDAALAWLTGGVPYLGFLGIVFDRRGDEVTAILPLWGERWYSNAASRKALSAGESWSVMGFRKSG